MEARPSAVASVALVFCLGLLLSGAGVHTWEGQQRSKRPQVQAGISIEADGPGDRLRVGLQLANVGRTPVTVQKARLRVRRPDGDRRWLTVLLVLVPGYAALSIKGAHARSAPITTRTYCCGSARGG